MTHQPRLLTVFAARPDGGPGGGNPTPIVADAAGMSDAQMQAIARRTGHESSFVLPAPEASGCDFALRYWVPNHEMAMCGHATVGAVWLLDHLGRLASDRVTIWTQSGKVEARITGHDAGGARVEISQPRGEVLPLADTPPATAEILEILGIPADALGAAPIRNARTSRPKTLIPLATPAALDALAPDFARIEALCDRIGSTGLYPYAPADPARSIFEARQFPKSSGYPEDAATGIAAAALAFGLLASGEIAPETRALTVRQGRAMGRPSEIRVQFRGTPPGANGCWIGGPVRLESE